MSWLARLFGGRRDNPSGASAGGSLDDQTRGQLARAGGDLAKPTDVVNYLYLPDEARAQQAGTELRAAGFTVVVRPAATGQNWLARANRDMIPSAENIAQMRALFEGLASRLGGDYDGWEAAVTK
ncbi:MAG TPA: ribonuclease E inhibitor RraB [Candidatus Dormibacteraeota bacterium]|nr:ribonuclease E inhibitor RraB [Candidatus Dormibacteraeota bacterium]